MAYNSHDATELLNTNPTKSSDSRRELISALLVDNLLSPDPQSRQAAVMLAYNISWSIATARKLLVQFVCAADEDWITEILAAICSVLENEFQSESDNDEILFRILTSIGFLTILSSEPIMELFNLLAKPLISNQRPKKCSTRLQGILQELDRL